jgi:hypothetical protein
MKTKKREMYGVDREGDRRSYAILAQIFFHHTPLEHQKRGEAGLWARFLGAEADPEVELSGNNAGLEKGMFSDAVGLAGRLGNATVIGGAVSEEPIPS